jgi:hypothetical protein
MILTSLLLFPKYFKNQKQMIFPILDAMAQQDFPKLEFKNHELVSILPEPKILTTPSLVIVIDPSHRFQQKFLFPGFWLWIKKQAVQWGYQSTLRQGIAYNNPFLRTLFQELANFHEGNGFLDRTFFIKLKSLIEKTTFSNGVFFTLNCFVMCLIISFCVAFLGYLYSKFIGTTLPWKSIRILSYYTLTPVVLFFVCCYHLNLDMIFLEPVLFVMYLLFLFSVIRRFKKPQTESNEDPFFP